MQGFEISTRMTDGVIATAYPWDGPALTALASMGVSRLVNLHERPHAPELLAAYGFTEVHIPVGDFTAPAAGQIGQAIAAIEAARAEDRIVAVHCGAGLGRTGTVVASYFTRSGMAASDAIERVRTLRPGSIETEDQYDAVIAFASTV